MPEPLTIALVGIGGYGDIYLATLLQNEPGTGRLIAGVDPHPPSNSHSVELRRRGIPVFPTLEALYAEMRPELVVLSSPLHLHAEQTCYALDHGSHVLCEKPLAATPDDAARMIAARDRAGKTLAIGYQWAFDPGIRRLKRDILSGRFGRPTRFRTRVYWPRSDAYYSRNSWAGRLWTADHRPVLDSPVNNACAHYIHNMLYLLGDTEDRADWPATVSAELYRANDIENYDTAIIRSRTLRGVELLAVLTHATEHTTEPTLEYAFERAVILSGDARGSRIVAKMTDGSEIDYGLQPTGSDAYKIWATVESIRSNTPPACSAEAAAAHTALMYAAQQSMTPVRFPADCVVVTESAGSRYTSVRGLEKILDECYRTFRFPHELGIPWAKPGKTVRVEGLTRFETAVRG